MASYLARIQEDNPIKERGRVFKKAREAPYKIYEAPGLTDDSHLNLLHWSSNNSLAVSLGHSVWTLNVDSQKVNKVYEAANPLEQVTSVQWNDKNSNLALGNMEGYLNIWDLEASRKTRTISGHSDRINCIAWNGYNLISTASRDSMIYTRDLRAPPEYVLKFAGHDKEISGLKWSPSGKYLASGGSDNKALVWKLHSTQPEMKFERHSSEVRALTWSSHCEELLLTGDKKRINMWNVLSGSKIKGMETETEVYNILFSKNSNEFVTTHGEPNNQIIVWSYPDLKRDVLDAKHRHSKRILFISDSPNGENIATGASDETVRFWNVFEKSLNKEANKLFPSSWDLR